MKSNIQNLDGILDQSLKIASRVISIVAFPALLIVAFEATTARSVALCPLRDPPKEPKGVRTPDRNTTSLESTFMTLYSPTVLLTLLLQALVSKS